MPSSSGMANPYIRTERGGPPRLGSGPRPASQRRGLSLGRGGSLANRPTVLSVGGGGSPDGPERSGGAAARGLTPRRGQRPRPTVARPACAVGVAGSGLLARLLAEPLFIEGQETRARQPSLHPGLHCPAVGRPGTARDSGAGGRGTPTWRCAPAEPPARCRPPPAHRLERVLPRAGRGPVGALRTAVPAPPSLAPAPVSAPPAAPAWTQPASADIEPHRARVGLATSSAMWPPDPRPKTAWRHRASCSRPICRSSAPGRAPGQIAVQPRAGARAEHVRWPAAAGRASAPRRSAGGRGRRRAASSRSFIDGWKKFT